MAKMSSYRRVLEQDYPEDQELIKKLGITLNSSFEEIYSALNNRLTFRDNISATIAEFTVTVDSTGTPKNRTSFKLLNNQTITEGLLVINASGASDPTLLPQAGVFVSFVRSENIIIIQNIKGLLPDNSYVIKVIVLG
jgi:hypothetical protein